jgi:tetratricopeptide (TPR) repeat protein
LPSLAILIGGLVALWRLGQRRMPSRRRLAGLYLAGVAAATLLALLYMTLKIPSYAQSKAFYAQPALPALCAAFAFGADWLLRQCRGRRAAWMGSALLWLLGIWAVVAYASVWVLPSRPPALVQRGHVLLLEGEIDAAEEHFLGALRGDPDQAAAQLGLAGVHAARGDWRAAGLAASQALESAPPDSRILIARALTALAESDLRAGRIDAAEDSLRRAVRLAPGERDAHVLLASLLLSQEREGEAIEALADQLGAFPTEHSVQLQLARLYRARSAPRSAARHLAHALRLDPSDGNVRRALADSLAASGDARRAADVLRERRDSAR